MKTVFISHVDEDRDWAYELVKWLEKKEIDCWRSNLQAGGESGLQEEDASRIKQCDFFLPVFSEASVSGGTLFHEALDLARQMSQSAERKYNFIIPLVTHKSVNPEDDKIGANMILFFPDFNIGLKNLLRAMERKRKIPTSLIDWMIGATGNATGSLIAQYLPELIDLLAKSLGDEVQPPDHNISYCPQQFPGEGGELNVFLDPDSECDQIVKLRHYAIENELEYISFFVGGQGERLGVCEESEEIDMLSPISLDVPADTRVVFIGFGEPAELDEIRVKLNEDKTLPGTKDAIPWAVYGPGKDAI